MSYPKVIENLIEQLMRLPGIGRRSAERIVFCLLDRDDEDSRRLSGAISELKEKLRFCKLCNNFAELEVCPICMDVTRDSQTICVVESPKDAIAIEKTGSFKGQYYVLLGVISPSDGQGPDDLNTAKLLHKVRTENIQEVVIATDADMEGELTALHLIKLLRPLGVRISRIGVGIPAGGSVEFADLSTLTMSFKSRRDVFTGEPKPRPGNATVTAPNSPQDKVEEMLR
jgi:recombination protein RecR